ncbi:MAG: hypothetical protein J0L82_05020 [Deltaproteobacteria bacterium]|nr:hypothetical protein [Deltaproteobacteria bacterium]
MSGAFDLRKLPFLDVLLLVKLRDKEISGEAVSGNIRSMAELVLEGTAELSIKEMRLQILVLDLCADRSPMEREVLTESLRGIPGATLMEPGSFGSRREEAAFIFSKVVQLPFSILVELPTVDAWSARNVLELLRPIVNGADFSVGQRTFQVPIISLIKLKALNGYFWLRFGYPVGDWTSEFLSWRKWAVSAVEYQSLNAQGVGFLAELKNHCLDKGFRTRPVQLVGLSSESELEFLRGAQILREVRGIRSTI